MTPVWLSTAARRTERMERTWRGHEDRENSRVNKTETTIREAIMLDKLQPGAQEQMCHWMPWDNTLRSSLEANLERSVVRKWHQHFSQVSGICHRSFSCRENYESISER